MSRLLRGVVVCLALAVSVRVATAAEAGTEPAGERVQHPLVKGYTWEEVVASKDELTLLERVTGYALTCDVKEFPVRLKEKPMPARSRMNFEYDQFLAMAWCQRDPEGALAFWRANPKSMGTLAQFRFYELLAERNPKEALKLWNDPATGWKWDRHYLKVAMRGWVKKDPDEALAYALADVDKWTTPALLVIEAVVEKDGRRAMGYVEKLPRRERNYVREYMWAIWFQRFPTEAWSWRMRSPLASSADWDAIEAFKQFTARDREEAKRMLGELKARKSRAAFTQAFLSVEASDIPITKAVLEYREIERESEPVVQMHRFVRWAGVQDEAAFHPDHPKQDWPGGAEVLLGEAGWRLPGPPLERAGELELLTLADTQPREALDQCAGLKLSEADVDKVRGRIVQWVGVRDPKRAFALLMERPELAELRSKAGEEVMASWGSKDPEAALSWLQTQPVNDATRCWKAGILRGWSTKDASAAMKAAEGMEIVPGNQWAVEKMAKEMFRQNRAEAALWTLGQPRLADLVMEEMIRSMGELVGSYTKDAVKMAAAWKPAKEKGVGVDWVVSEWMRRDSQGCLEWIRSSKGESFYREAMQAAAAVLARRDAKKARALLEELPAAAELETGKR